MIGKSWALIMLLLLVSPVTWAGEDQNFPEKPETGIADQILEEEWNRITKKGKDSKDEERYLCVPDKATGFSFNKASKSWVQTKFKVDRKYLLSEPKIMKKNAALEFTQIGDKTRLCWSRGFNDNTDIAYFLCVGGELQFNKKTGRYVHSQLEGYIDGDSGIIGFGTLTPYIEIGKCSPF